MPSTTFQRVMTESWVIENAATSWLDAYRRSDEGGASVYDERPWSNAPEHRWA
jgi:hypothetical protein